MLVAVAMATSAHDVAMRYVLPVSWMTSFYTTTMLLGQNQARCLEVRQVAAPVGREDNYDVLVEFVRMRRRGRSLLSTIDLQRV